MSADVFRNIVKTNIKLYRDAETASKNATALAIANFKNDKIGHEIYENALESLELTAELDDIPIEKKLPDTR